MSDSPSKTLFALVIACVAAPALVGCGPSGSGDPSSSAAASAAAGKVVFTSHCSLCHGEIGRGDGAASVGLVIKPRDLTTEPYKYVDIAGHDTEVQALISYIKVGRVENGMPGFDGAISDDQIRQVAQYVAALRPQPGFVEDAPADEDSGG